MAIDEVCPDFNVVLFNCTLDARPCKCPVGLPIALSVLSVRSDSVRSKNLHFQLLPSLLVPIHRYSSHYSISHGYLYDTTLYMLSMLSFMTSAIF